MTSTPLHVTKNDLYAELVQIGIAKGYVVIPEFRVSLENQTKKHKNIDLVWATRRTNENQKARLRKPRLLDVVRDI